MNLVFSGLMLMISCLFLSVPAEARGMMFGDDEDIKFIQDIDLKGEQSEALFLGYKVTTKYFVAGIYMKKDGYVLGIKKQKDGENRYYALTDEKITKLQVDKSLPTPLPVYEVSALDWTFGYSLWIILAGVGLYTFIESWWKKRRS